MSELLAVSDLSVRYGAVDAVRGVNLHVSAGETVALLGANGAGKSSTLRAMMGLTPASGGSITFNGSEMLGKHPEAVVRQGMTLVPEGRRVFPGLTVEENIGLAEAGRASRSVAPGTPETFDDVCELFPILGQRRSQIAGSLSGGEQQQLAIARALMAWPLVLLMDEPSLGLAPRLADALFDLIRLLGERGVTILLVEQNVQLALDVSSRAYVMATGQVRLMGSSSELARSTGVQRAYLGLGHGE